MEESIRTPKYTIGLTFEERLALTAIVRYDGDEDEIAEKAAGDVPNLLDTTKENFAATIRTLVTELKNFSIKHKDYHDE